jgi:hypothetical protein
MVQLSPKRSLTLVLRQIMSTNNTPDTRPDHAVEGAAPDKSLSPAARRALEEAAQRRLEIDARVAEIAKQKELQGRGGLEPVRYDDWEVKGLASDF